MGRGLFRARMLGWLGVLLTGTPAWASAGISVGYSSDECCFVKRLNDCSIAGRDANDLRCGYGSMVLEVGHDRGGTCANSPCHDDPYFNVAEGAACVPYVSSNEPELVNGIDDNCDGLGLGDEFCDGIDNDNDGAIDEDAGSCLTRVLMVADCMTAASAAADLHAARTRWVEFFEDKTDTARCGSELPKGKKLWFEEAPLSVLGCVDGTPADKLKHLKDAGVRIQDFDVITFVHPETASCIGGEATGAGMINVETGGVVPYDGEYETFTHEFGHLVGLVEEYRHVEGPNEVDVAEGCDPTPGAGCCDVPTLCPEVTEENMCFGNRARDLGPYDIVKTPEGGWMLTGAPAASDDKIPFYPDASRCIMSWASAPGWDTGSDPTTGAGSHRGFCWKCLQQWIGSEGAPKCANSFAGVTERFEAAGSIDPQGKIVLVIAEKRVGRAMALPPASGDLVIEMRDGTGALLTTYAPKFQAAEPSLITNESFWLRVPAPPGASFLFTLTALRDGEVVSHVTGGGSAPVAVTRPAVAECTSTEGTAVVLDGSGSFDPDGDTLSFAWSTSSGLIAEPDAEVTSGVFSLGTHDVELTVSDGTGASELVQTTVTVEDSLPPVLSGAAIVTFDTCLPKALPVMLTPPTAQDGCGGEVIVDGAIVTVNGKPVMLDATDPLSLPVGQHWVNWLAEDEAGNVAELQQQIVVRLKEDGSCCAPGQSKTFGTAGVDALAPASDGPQCLFGLGSGDQLVSRAGADSLFGGDGADTLTAGAGNDVLSGGAGSDQIYGGQSAFLRAFGGDDADSLYANLASSSELFGGKGDDHLVGSAGADLLVPGPGRDATDAGAGNDVVRIYSPCELEAGESLDGGPGADRLISPLSLAQLTALGVTVTGFETVEIDTTSTYLSECF